MDNAQTVVLADGGLWLLGLIFAVTATVALIFPPSKRRRNRGEGEGGLWDDLGNDGG